MSKAGLPESAPASPIKACLPDKQAGAGIGKGVHRRRNGARARQTAKSMLWHHSPHGAGAAPAAAVLGSPGWRRVHRRQQHRGCHAALAALRNCGGASGHGALQRHPALQHTVRGGAAVCCATRRACWGGRERGRPCGVYLALELAGPVFKHGCGTSRRLERGGLWVTAGELCAGTSPFLADLALDWRHAPCRYGRPSASDAEVEEAARVAAIHDAITLRFRKGWVAQLPRALLARWGIQAASVPAGTPPTANWGPNWALRGCRVARAAGSAPCSQRPIQGCPLFLVGTPLHPPPLWVLTHPPTHPRPHKQTIWLSQVRHRRGGAGSAAERR